MNLDIIVADPSGNITIFVMTPVLRDDYVNTAEKLLALPYQAEQVAFVTGDYSFDMAGLEFCGNATRAFGMIAAKGDQEQILSIVTSGIDSPVPVNVDPKNKYSAAQMPLPLSVTDVSWQDEELKINGTLVDFGGIMHLVVTGLPASAEIFEKIKKLAMDQLDPPALGVMFYDPAGSSMVPMVPVVYVRDIDTVYFEGSCASGTAAASCFLAREGTHTYSIQQPAGCLSSTVTKHNGAITSVTVEGVVDISPIVSVTI